MRVRFAHLVWSLAASVLTASAQPVTATINITTANPTALNSNFSGFNYEGAASYEPYDYQFNAVAAQLSPGWIRYPGGIASDAFSWQTGNMISSAVGAFSSTSFESTLTASISEFAGKGGQQFLDVGNQAILLGAQLIVVINGYTDTPASAGELAALAVANHIPVAAWELCNEPYFFVPLFWSSGKDYATQMKPYYQAIKANDPTATVALFFSDPGNLNASWNTSIFNYGTPYWDAITYHFYGAESSGTSFTQWMTDENANLYNDSASYVTSYVQPLNPTGKVLVSEFNPTGSDLGNNPSLTNGTLYAGVYAAEYIMRMSSVPGVLHVGMHALSATYGINANDRHFNDVQTAYNNNTTIDTATLDYGFFPNAEAEGVAILNGVLRNANQVYNSTVTGGATVAATGIGQIPALYAQAYSNAAGYQSVVITNKSATAHTVTIERDGTAVGGTLPMQFITGTDPSTQNTSTTDSPIAIQSSTSTNPVPVPAYSVVRVELSGGITIHTNPPGLQFTVDTQPVFTAPQFLSLTPGSHSISVAPTQAGKPGTQYVFANWSDGGTPSHNITAGNKPATYTANFTPQYLLTATVAPSGSGNAAPSGAYYNAGAEITVTATGTAPYAFSSWGGDASGSTNPIQVIMNTPKSVTAQFVNTAALCEINGQGLPNVADVQIVIDEALGDLPPLNDLNGDGVVNLVDVQIEVNAALNRGCSATAQ